MPQVAPSIHRRLADADRSGAGRLIAAAEFLDQSLNLCPLVHRRSEYISVPIGSQ